MSWGSNAGVHIVDRSTNLFSEFSEFPFLFCVDCEKQFKITGGLFVGHIKQMLSTCRLALS